MGWGVGGPEGGAGRRGGEALGPRRPHRQGRGGGPVASEAALDERVAEQNFCCGPPLLLHKHLPQEVPACVGHALGKHGLGGLRGNLKNGRHGLVFGPRGFLGQHFHNRAGNTPVDKDPVEIN